MLSRARRVLRKLRGGSRSSRDSEPALPTPATTPNSEPVEPPHPAIHMSDAKRLPSEYTIKPRSILGYIHLEILVANAKGAPDNHGLYMLLMREKDGNIFDPYCNYETDFFYDSYIYQVGFMQGPSGDWPYTAMLEAFQHICLVFTYDASSRASWDETVAACERLHSRCRDKVLPFLAVVIAAMDKGEGEPSVAHEEAEAFARQRNWRFIKVSPVTGRGLCDPICSLVELAHPARNQHILHEQGRPQRRERALAIAALFREDPGHDPV
ncbi:hypothetical protein BDW74DRAFT_150199 [Aspergillus multicolor]|uniref:uncharacterized protein n=1 Tax=Aspergillus multicolor TaxID=41759 RepID=UPI003CCE02A0